MRALKYLLVALSLFLSGAAFAQNPGVIPDVFGKTYSDNAYVRFGNSQDVVCGYNTSQTSDALVCGLSTDSETFIIMQKGDISTDVGLSDFGTPSFVILNADPTKYLRLYHDGTNAVFDTSTGIVSFPDGVDLGTGNMSFGTNLVFEGSTNDASETTVTVTDPTADRTITVPNTSGYLLLSPNGQDGTNAVTVGDTGKIVVEGSTADTSETTIEFANPSGDRTITFPDSSGTVVVGGNTNVTSASNQICNTTCGTAGKCIGGFDAGSTTIVSCADATADKCFCTN